MKHLTVRIDFEDDQKVSATIGDKLLGGKITEIAGYDIFACYDCLDELLDEFKYSHQTEHQVNEVLNKIKNIICKG